MMSTAPPRILVVDDEEAILETMTFTFEDDYEVLHIERMLAAALEHARREIPGVAVVLTDQRMPNMRRGRVPDARPRQRHPEPPCASS